ncbi:MAG TPA: polysaccharide deacetylase family protein [Flavobacteriales bacterium]
MLILTSYNHPRLLYAVKVVFEDYPSDIEFTYDVASFLNHDGVKLEYGTSRQIPDSFFIPAQEMLWNDRVIKHEISHGQWDGLPTLYVGDGNIPFDIFSAAFYLIVRYEEYFEGRRDTMGRFPASESIAHRVGFLHRPIIDLWRVKLESLLRKHWSDVPFTKTPFRFISTIDVDSAFAYRYKGWGRTLGGMAKDVVNFRIANLVRRMSTLVGWREDDFDTYDYIEEQCIKRGVANIYFFLLADFGRFDKNVPHTSGPLRELIRRASRTNEIGIHPGVASNASLVVLKKELERLEDILEKTCTKGRQHYLMLKFPDTYRHYLKVGIAEDYSMGFADDVGFRAGTSRAFQWYDLERNEATCLTVHPFAAMDVTLQRYQSLSIDEAIALNKRMMDDVYVANGTFISLWHNETLSDIEQWKGWRQVWEAILEHGRQLMNKH